MRKRTSRRSDTSTSTSTHNEQNIPTEYSYGYAWTVSGLIAYFNTLCHTILLYTAYLHRIREEVTMGVLDWINGRKDEGEGEEMVSINHEGRDDEVQKGRVGDGTVKRRRHHATKGILPL